MVAFQEVTIEKFEDIIAYQKTNWIYRGQSDASWSLETSLERYCKEFYSNLDRAKKLECIFMREFRRRYHHYSIQVPAGVESLEWPSLMRHHGAPTRLLDWTYSIYVALYFGIENKSDSAGDHAIWAMDAKWSIITAIDIVKQNGKEYKHLREAISEENEQDYYKTFFAPPCLALVYPINSFKLNERVVQQKGVHVIPGDVSKSFEDNLRALEGYDDMNKLVKLRIPTGVRKELLKKLSDMGLTRANLFPGIDGFAQSLAVYPDPPALYGSNLYE